MSRKVYWSVLVVLSSCLLGWLCRSNADQGTLFFGLIGITAVLSGLVSSFKATNRMSSSVLVATVVTWTVTVIFYVLSAEFAVEHGKALKFGNRIASVVAMGIILAFLAAIASGLVVIAGELIYVVLAIIWRACRTRRQKNDF